MMSFSKKLPYKQLVAIIYTIILFLDKLDLTVVNVTFPTVGRYFNVSIVNTDWINMSFLLALAVSIPISSWLGERFGLKKIYVYAIIIFGLSSTLCIWAPSLMSLYILRFLQGIGGGLLIPVGMTMLYQTYSKSEYASITSFTFLPSLLAPAIAPFLGGILVQAFGWRFVFVFSGPICLVLAMVAIFYLKESPRKTITRFDWIGFFLGSLLLITIFYTPSQVGKPHSAYILIVGLLLFCLLTYYFISWEYKQKHPLINLKFFHSTIFRNINLIQLCFQICHFGAIFLIGLYLQIGIGFIPSLAGLIMGMQAFGAMVTSRPSVKLFNHWGPRLPLTIGFIGIAILSPCILLIHSNNMLIFGIVLFFIRGLFSGLCGTPIQTLSVIGFSTKNLAQVNSIFNIGRQIGINLGIAISSIMIFLGLSYTGLHGVTILSSNQANSVFVFGFVTIFIIASLGALLVQKLENTEINMTSIHTYKTRSGSGPGPGSEKVSLYGIRGPFRCRTLNTAEINLTKPYWITGQGEAGKKGILLIHGFSSTLAIFAELVKDLSTYGYTISAPSLPGHGNHPEDLILVNQQDWLQAVEDAFFHLQQQCNQVIVIGFSLGGILAIDLAIKHLNIKQLILIAPAICIKWHLRILFWTLPCLIKLGLRFLPTLAGDIKKPNVYEIAYRKVATHGLSQLYLFTQYIQKILPQLKTDIMIFYSHNDHLIDANSSIKIFSKCNIQKKYIFWLDNSYHVMLLDNDSKTIIDTILQNLMPKSNHAPY